MGQMYCPAVQPGREFVLCRYHTGAPNLISSVLPGFSIDRC